MVDGWSSICLKDVVTQGRKICYGIVQPGEFEEGGILLIRGKDYSFGWQDIGAFFRVSEEIDRPYKRSKVKANDILLTIVGAGTGNVALVPSWLEGANITQTTARISVDVAKHEYRFVYYLLQSRAGQHNVYKYMKGGAQPGLNIGDIEKFMFLFPPLSEQKKIAQILSTWDKAIAMVEKLIENSQQKKKALMQHLLTGKKRFSGFDGEWKKIELGKLLEYKQPTPFLVKSTKYSDEYATPVLTAGKTFVLGYTNENFGVYEEGLPVIIFDDFTTASKFVDFPFKAKSSAMKILTAKQGVSIKYIFEAMQMINYSVGGHQRHWISIYSNLVVSLPSIEEQQKISSAFSSANQEIETWQQELEHLKQEKKALMQQLFTGKRRVKVDEALS